MLFSLVLATYGRIQELRICLDSLARQSCKDFELIIVDQNSPGTLDHLLDDYRSQISIVHLRSAKGLSKARNVGLAAAQGQIIAFPDDDGAYPDLTLERVARLFTHNPQIGGIIGGMQNHQTPVDQRGDLELGAPLNTYNIWFKGMSLGIFLRRNSLPSELFDERLGLGSGTPWGSGEESDLLVRILRSGHSLFRCPKLILQHDDVDFDLAGLEQKSYSYAKGRMFALAKLQMPLWFKALNVLWPVLGSLRSSGSKRRYYLAMFRGRLNGFFKPGI